MGLYQIICTLLVCIEYKLFVQGYLYISLFTVVILIDIIFEGSVIKMADDTFGLLTRMYADFTSQFKEIRGKLTNIEDRLTSVEDRLTSVEGRLTSVEGRLTSVESELSSVKGRMSSMEGDVSSLKGMFGKLQLKIENDIDRKIDLLLETRHEVNNRLDVIENKIDILTTKVDRHDIEIKVIKAAK